MALFGWFSKKKQEVQVSKQQGSAMQDAAMAAAFAEAGEHETARTLTTPTRPARKVLVIGNEAGFSEKLTSYALDMAERLDLELVALSLTEPPAATESFVAAASERGITLTLLQESGDQEEVIARLRAEDSGLRYVLTEPDPEMARASRAAVSIPVFDLGSYQGIAA